MIKVYIKKQGNYPLSSPQLKKKLKKFLKDKGIVSNADVSVYFSGKSRMKKLTKKYLGEEVIHNVLTFATAEGNSSFVYPPDDLIHLGEVVICYPEVLEEAKKQGKMIDDKVYELAEHGAMHLLGIHHD
jgi:rRNA maturation RNase YbeY